MSTSAIEAVFGPAPANTDLTEDSRVGNNAAVIILWIIAAVAVVLRMISRKMLQAGLRWDDFVIVIALVSDVHGSLPPKLRMSPTRPW